MTNHNVLYTDTGVKPLLVVDPTKRHTVGIFTTDDTDICRIDVGLVNNNNRFVFKKRSLGKEIYYIEMPVSYIGIKITENNSGSIRLKIQEG